MSIKFKNYFDYIDGENILTDKNLNLSGFFTGKQMSASAIKSWKQCPAKTLLEQLQPSESEALNVGSKVHEILEKHFTDNISKEDTIKLCDSKDLELTDSERKKVKEYINAFFKIEPYEQLQDDTDFITEQLIETEVSPLDIKLPVPIKGFIDRIDMNENGTFLIDYKTASRAPMEDQYIDQMIIYKWIYEEFFGQKVNDIYIASLYTDKPQYIKQDITLRKQSELIDKIFEVNDEVQESLQAYKYKKKKGFYCQWCPFCNQCDKHCGEEVELTANPFL